MLILKKRIIKSMKYADIATGESEFSINLLKQEANRRNFNCHYDVLPNGFDIKSINKDIVYKISRGKKGKSINNEPNKPLLINP